MARKGKEGDAKDDSLSLKAEVEQVCVCVCVTLTFSVCKCGHVTSSTLLRRGFQQRRGEWNGTVN